MKLPSWRRLAPSGVAAVAVTALVVALIPAAGPATAAPSQPDAAAPAATAAATAAQNAFTACQAQPPAPAGSVDYFLKVDGIPGESQDAQHLGEIVVDSFLWGVNADQTGCARTRQRPALSDLSVTKNLDKASPKLAGAATTGQHIPTAVLTARRSGGGKGSGEFLEIRLQDVTVSSYAISSTGGSYPQDTFDLNFAQIQFTYTPQNADGSAGTAVVFCTNVRTDKPC